MKLLTFLLLTAVSPMPTKESFEASSKSPNVFERLVSWFPGILPNHYGDHSGRHDMPQDHLVPTDYKLTFQQIVEENGFAFSEFETETDDGYVLSMYRITNPDLKPGAPVVFLQHGLVDTADAWIINHPDQAPAFVFARKGYDVWLGNSRGSRYSRKHTYLNPDSSDWKARQKFWNFSWQEMAEFDAPAMLDFILESTGREKLTYIGHSTGNTQMFYNFTRPNKKFFTSRVNLFVALAPVTRVQNIKPWFFRWLASETDWIKWATDTFGWYEIFGFYANEWSRLVCGVTPSVCTNLEGMFLTSDPKYEDPDRFEVYMGHIPGGTSLKAYEHISQNLNSGLFQLYDYKNPAKNTQEYGRLQAPIVDLKEIQRCKGLKIAIFAGTSDDIGDLDDVHWARQQILSGPGKDLGILTHYEEVPGGFATFLVGLDMTYLHKVTELIEKYNPWDESAARNDDDLPFSVGN